MGLKVHRLVAPFRLIKGKKVLLKASVEEGMQIRVSLKYLHSLNHLLS